MPVGDLDSSFSGDGRRASNFGGTDEARAVLVQPNGSIVVAGGGGAAGSFCLARLRANGTLDTTFGSTGGAGSLSAKRTSRPSPRRCSRMARSCSLETQASGSPSRA